MAGAKCLLRTPSNFQSSAMFDVTETTTDAEGGSSESTLGSSVTACKKVLCSNSLLDSTEYWLRNHKPLCRLGLLEQRSDRSCTTVCFVNLDRHNGDRHDGSCIKKLASVSPELPRLIESLGVRQPKENEILLLSGLQPPEPYPPEHAHAQSHRAADVCLVQCARGRRPTQPGSIIFEINKFLIGLQSGQERRRLSRLANQCFTDDDTNRSVSSIEEDFLTASEHLGEDSEEDPFRNEAEGVDVGEVAMELLRGGRPPPRHRRGAAGAPSLDQNDSEDSEATLRTSPSSASASSSSQNPRESAGRYATNLAESVLQDAFIRLSQDEAPFSPAAALSLPSSSSSSSSFQLPKIVIVQSPDCGEEGAGDWPDDGPEDTPRTPAEQDRPPPQRQHQPHSHHRHHHRHHHNHQHPHSKHQHQRQNQEAQQQHQAASKSVEMALACAASVIGTISTPQVAQHLTLDPTRTATEGDEEEDQTEEEEEEEEEECGDEEADFSLTSAMCGMAQVAGAVAAVDLPFDPMEPDDGEPSLNGGRYSPSLGLLSAAQASAAVPLHASLAEGTSVEASRANLARALLSEATALLSRPRPPQLRSVAQLLESTQRRLLAGVTGAERSVRDEEQEDGGGEAEEEVEGEEQEYVEEEDEFVRDVAESVLAHVLEKAEKQRELEGREKDAGGSDWEGQLRESTEGVLFDVLQLTARRLSHISRRGGKRGSGDYTRRGGDGDRRSQARDRGGRGGGGVMGLVGSPQRTRKPSSDGEYAISMATEQEGGADRGWGRKEREREFSVETWLPSLEGSPLHDRIRGRVQEVKPYALSPQHSLGDTRAPITCFAEDLATTVVSMATELAAICLENSSGKQPWFCALKGAGAMGGAIAGGAGLESSCLLPACCSAAAGGLRKKHRPPRLSEIKRKTEEQPELMERLVNRVVDETINLDLEPVGSGGNGHYHGNHLNGSSNNTNGISDPFALFASEVTARILNCPELSIVDTSSTSATSTSKQQGPPSATSSPCPSSPRGRLQCERWSARGKAASCESIPEEEPSGLNGGRGGGGVTLGPGSRLGPDLSHGSSVSKQSSCESISDEFSSFIVGQMEAEGRGFDLLLDYYAGKSASNILQAAVQQAATGGRRNGHLSLRSSSCCLSKQSSTESITEEFYRYMLRNMDRDGRPELLHFGGGYGCGSVSGLSRAKEWSNSLLPPSPSARSPFCIRQSSVPDRRSSDSRLSVTAPIKANSFDGFARGSRGSTGGGVGDVGGLSVRPAQNASAAGLCKSDSCLYRLGQMDRATDILIHDTWSSSIESLMRKNKIIANPTDDSCDPCEVSLEMVTTTTTTTTTQPGVCNYASRLAADIVEGGRSAALGASGQPQQQQEVVTGRQHPLPVGERRRGFKHSRPVGGKNRPSLEQQDSTEGGAQTRGAAREVPLIHIEPDQKEESGEGPSERPAQVGAQRGRERTPSCRTSDRDKPIAAQPPPPSGESGPPQHRSFSNSSEDSGSGSWAQVVAPDDDPQEETSSFIHLSEGNGTSSTSSLGLVDLEGFQETSSQRISDESEKKDALKESLEESPSSTYASSGSSRELLVLNFDLEVDSVDVELRATLQWMAASELGAPTLHFRRSQQHNIHKFQRVVQLVSHRSWRVGDLFGAVVQYCQLLEAQQDTAPPVGLFDWLLETR